MSALTQTPLSCPAWVDTLCPPPPTPTGDAIETSQAAGYTRAHAILPGAAHLNAADLETQVEALYHRLLDTLTGTHPVRLWNGIPRLLEPMQPPVDEGQTWDAACPAHERFDRYMAFNSGRSRALHARFGDGEDFQRLVATATGIGCGGDAIVLHALAAPTAGTPVENPRQTPAWQYSKRYGPQPPCFARATHIETAGGPLLLVGGTASVVGEDTWHADDLAAQTEETARNLKALLEAGGFSFESLRNIRSYYANPGEAAEAERLTRLHLPQAAHIEMVEATVCRPGLVIEIEGVAGL